MAKSVLIEELHVSVLAPPGLSQGEYDAIRLALDTMRWRARLRRWARAVVQKEPALSKIRVKVSR